MTSGISLVVPIRNEAATLAALWKSIRDQTLAPDEIVMVDGGSTDDTIDVLRRLTAGDRRVRIEAVDAATPGKGRNIGIQLASNEWIALTDAGIILEPTWLEELVRARDANPSVRVVYGQQEPLVTSFFERCAALAYISLLRDTPAGKLRGPAVSSVLLHRSAWTAAGGFPDTRSTEDLVFISRLEALGTARAWAPAATAHWQPRSSLAATYRRFSVYSTQSVLSGRHRDWHYQVVWKYVMGLPCVALGFRGYRVFWAVPIAGVAARVAASIWRRRELTSVAQLLNPFQFLGVALILLTIDVAMFVGWARALLVRAKGGFGMQAVQERAS